MKLYSYYIANKKNRCSAGVIVARSLTEAINKLKVRYNDKIGSLTLNYLDKSFSFEFNN